MLILVYVYTSCDLLLLCIVAGLCVLWLLVWFVCASAGVIVLVCVRV